MDFSKVSRKDIEKLIASYKMIKYKYGINLDQQEKTVKKLTEEKRNNPNALNQMLLYGYLKDEIKPLLAKFEGNDSEIVKQYFRYISEQKNITPGIKLT